ncbi:MAG: hypothetical protein H9W83_08885 [Leuconostoc sp.]|nr:hypothetical protein [Leuconostoc sp.]
MNFSMSMTIEELVVEMNNGGNQSTLYKVSKIPKDLLPYLFRAAGYIREKQKYIPTADVQRDLTIEKLVPLAKALHQETKLVKLNKVVTAPVPSAVVVENEIAATAVVTPTVNTGSNVSEFSFNTANKAEMQSAILEVLDLTAADLDAIRSLKGEAPTGTIYEAISKLQSRRRANKTYYVSEEIVQEVQAFTEAHAIKTSQFVEIALLEAMKKYRG